MSAPLELPDRTSCPGRAGQLVRSRRLGEDRVAPERLVAALVAGGVRVRGFQVDDTSLEDRFVALTGEGFDVVR